MENRISLDKAVGILFHNEHRPSYGYDEVRMLIAMIALNVLEHTIKPEDVEGVEDVENVEDVEDVISKLRSEVERYAEEKGEERGDTLKKIMNRVDNLFDECDIHIRLDEHGKPIMPDVPTDAAMPFVIDMYRLLMTEKKYNRVTRQYKP